MIWYGSSPKSETVGAAEGHAGTLAKDFHCADDTRMADPRTTSDEWVSVGAYPDVESAQAVAGRLSVEGVQNRLLAREPGGPLFGVLGEWSVLVPPESVAAAARILAEPPPTDAELTALALEDPPPDDFDPSANPVAQPRARGEAGP